MHHDLRQILHLKFMVKKGAYSQIQEEKNKHK